MTEVLGPALVAGDARTMAMPIKIGDARTMAMHKGITECRVELLSKRQKAKMTLPAASDNSVESDDVLEGIYASDIRLSLSMTDQHIQLDLPGDRVMESATAGPSRENVAKRKEIAAATTASTEPRPVSLTMIAMPHKAGPTYDEAVRPSGTRDVPTEIAAGGEVVDKPHAPGLVEIPVLENVKTAIRKEKRTPRK